MTDLRVFALDSLPDEPWLNGGGRTRTIATQPREAFSADSSDGVPWDWRVSVAALEGDAAFSSFPGVERTSVLLSPGSLTLSVGDRTPHRLEHVGDLISYPGDAPTHATLDAAVTPATRSTGVSLLNVMTRRGAARARVRVLPDSATLSARSLAVLVVDGGWRAIEIASENTAGRMARHERTFDLLAGQGAWIGWAPTQREPNRTARLQLERLSPDGLLVAIEIDPTPA